jgi:hypothetical protein
MRSLILRGAAAACAGVGCGLFATGSLVGAFGCVLVAVGFLLRDRRLSAKGTPGADHGDVVPLEWGVEHARMRPVSERAGS